MARAATRSEADPQGRLELARGLLCGYQNRAQDRVPAQPDARALPEARVLPVVEPLARLLPAGGLRRGSTVAVPPGPGSTSLMLALLAELSRGGGWIGVVGRPGLGVVAAAEAGIRLERLALVPRPGADLLAVTSALLDGLDAVVLAGAERIGISGPDRQRLAARSRQRGAVLLPMGPWPGADLELRCSDAQWHGIGTGLSGGCGRLRSRRVRVRLRGRGIAPGGLDARLLLPAPDGGIAEGWAADGARADQLGADQSGVAVGSGGGDRERDPAPSRTRVAG